jgi:hypothetical protein
VLRDRGPSPALGNKNLRVVSYSYPFPVEKKATTEELNHGMLRTLWKEKEGRRN